MRRSVSIDVLLPILYLKGISAGEFARSFEPILGHEPKNLSSNVISKLKDHWFDEYEVWLRRDLGDKEYVYLWVDGVYMQARMESEKNCMLVIMGADSSGKKELIALDDGFRESKESWKNLLLNLKERGFKCTPRIAVGDGALGFWGALTEIFPQTVHQRCWVHKTCNLLDKLPKSEQEKAKKMIHDIYLAATYENALKAWKSLITMYGVKYPKFLECLQKDQKELLAFYDFPAEHWIHLRTTNPIESTFATVKHRTVKSKNCFSRKTLIGATFKLFQEAQKRWVLLRSRHRLAEVIKFEKFINGINQKELKNDTIDEKNYAA
jgi:putative transposase